MAKSGEITDPCPVPALTDAHDPVFQDPRVQPFPDQAEDARVADPVGQETEEPFLAHRVERLCILLPSSRTQFCADRDLIQLASPQSP